MKEFEAFKFAADAHSGHYRKSTKTPYITHLAGVCKILCEQNCAEDIVTAGILHDTVEDTNTTIQEIEQRFGTRVAELVTGATEKEKMQDNGQEAPWVQRKENSIKFYEEKATDEQLLIVAADKLDNIRDISRTYNRIGDDLWSRFNAGKEKQEWVYRKLAEVLVKRGEKGGDALRSITAEFAEEVDRLFK